MFQDPPETILLHRIQFSVSQAFKFQSIKDPKKRALPPPAKMIFRTIDASSAIGKLSAEPKEAIFAGAFQSMNHNSNRPFFKAEAHERTTLTTFERVC